MLIDDLVFKGKVSDIEKERFNDIDASGQIDIQNLKVAADDLPMPFSASKMHLTFTPKYVALDELNGQLGKSDLQATGRLDNLIAYLFSDNSLKGNLNLNSNSLNLDEIVGSGDAKDETKSTESTAIKVPDNIEFVGNINAKKVFYDGLELDNTVGKFRVKDETFYIDNLQANMLGGKAKIDGSYSTFNTEKPKLVFNYDINQFDIQEAFTYVNTVKALAPVAQYLEGNFSSDMKLNSYMNDDLSVDMKALTGDGQVRINWAKMIDMPIMKGITNTLQMTGNDASFLTNPEIKDAWTVLKFQDGKVAVEPFDVDFQDMKMNIAGLNGLDQSIDYDIKVTIPSDKFGNTASLANNFLAGKNLPFLDLAVPQNLTFNLDVTGFMKSPKVKIAGVSASETGKPIKEQIKDEIKETVKEEVETIKEDIKENVKEQVDDIKEDVKEDIKETIKDGVDEQKEDIKESIKDVF